MRRVAFAALLLLPLAACVSPYIDAKLGRISGSVTAVWVGENKFVYVPGWRGRPFAFETATTGRLIEPGLMYTDGGSIPRFAQAFEGFSPWGYAPAYIVHDWIFFGRHCYVDRELPGQERYADGKKFADVNGDPLTGPHHPRHRPITFNESALVLAEVIKTLVDYGQVPPRNGPAQLISSAVDSPFAMSLWNAEDACAAQRVHPRHIARVWVGTVGPHAAAPDNWKLSQWEKAEARKYFAEAAIFLKSVLSDALPPKQQALPPVVPLQN